MITPRIVLLLTALMGVAAALSPVNMGEPTRDGGVSAVAGVSVEDVDADAPELNKPSKTKTDREMHDVSAVAGVSVEDVDADAPELNKPNKTKMDIKMHDRLVADGLSDQEGDPGMDLDRKDVDTKIGSYCSTTYNNKFWVQYSYAYLRPPTRDGYYYDNRNCYYFFYSASGKKLQAYCYYLRAAPGDFLQIYGGPGNSFITKSGYHTSFIYTSTQNYLRIRFYSNASIRWNGFLCRIRAI